MPSSAIPEPPPAGLKMDLCRMPCFLRSSLPAPTMVSGAVMTSMAVMEANLLTVLAVELLPVTRPQVPPITLPQAQLILPPVPLGVALPLGSLLVHLLGTVLPVLGWAPPAPGFHRLHQTSRLHRPTFLLHHLHFRQLLLHSRLPRPGFHQVVQTTLLLD